MPLFHFTVNDYGASWFVSSPSREQAIEAVRAGIINEYERSRIYEQDEMDAKWGITPEQLVEAQTSHEKSAASHRDDDLRTLQCMIDGVAQYDGGHKCSIDELPDGEVIFSEVC